MNGDMSSYDPELKAKGDDGESRFRAWLDACGRSYVHVNQSPETFAQLFRPGKVKRPDFLVLIDSIGLLAVDVKNRRMKGDHFTLPIPSELKPTLAFERIFRLPVWYAYLHEPEDGAEGWHWISALRAAEVGEETKDKKGESYLRLHREHFEVLQTVDDFGSLFCHVVSNPEKIAGAEAGV